MKNHSISTSVVEDIHTLRLDLIATTTEIVQCEKDGGEDFRTRFSALVRAEVTQEWPPQDWEPHVLEYLLKQFEDHPHTVGWGRLVALRNPITAARTLIGTVGAIPPGSEMDHSQPTEIEVGYGILPAYQRQGFATEAVAGMMSWVQSQTLVSAFIAQTFPHLQPSIRVLEKSGFQLVGAGFEEGTILLRKKCETIIATEKTG